MNPDFLPQSVCDDARHVAKNLVRAYHLSKTDIDDILQEMHLAIHCALPRFRGTCQPATYMGGIIRRFAANYGRKIRTMCVQISTCAVRLNGEAETYDFVEKLCRKEEFSLLHEAVETQDEPFCTIGKLFLVGYSGRAIAETLGFSHSQFTKRLYPQFLQQLKATLNKKGMKSWLH